MPIIRAICVKCDTQANGAPDMVGTAISIHLDRHPDHFFSVSLEN